MSYPKHVTINQRYSAHKSGKCEKCGKKFTFNDHDISFRAKSRIIHVHRSCGQKAGMY